MPPLSKLKRALEKMRSVAERLVFHFPEDAFAVAVGPNAERGLVGIRVDYRMGVDTCRDEVWFPVAQILAASDESLARAARIMVVESIQENILKGESAIELLPREIGARGIVRRGFLARRRGARAATPQPP